MFGREITIKYAIVFPKCILSSQVVSLPLQSVIQEVANFCAAMDSLIDQDAQSGSNIMFSLKEIFCFISFLVSCSSINELEYKSQNSLHFERTTNGL